MRRYGISDNFIHNPYFRSPALNRLFSIVESTFSARCRTDTSGEGEENFLGQLRQLSSGHQATALGVAGQNPMRISPVSPRVRRIINFTR